MSQSNEDRVDIAKCSNESDQHRFDIITALADRGLVEIIRLVFFYLNGQDMLNAIAANLNWANALNGRRWLRQYFADPNDASTKSLMMLTKWQQMQKPRDVCTIFNETCSDYEKLVHNQRINCGTCHCFAQPSDRTLGPEWDYHDLAVNYKYIVVTRKFIGLTNRHKWAVVVYDRWTQEFVNAISGSGHVSCAVPEVSSPGNGSHMLVLTLVNCLPIRETAALIVNLTTSRVSTVRLMGPNAAPSTAFYLDLLFLSARCAGGDDTATVLCKLDDDGQYTVLKKFMPYGIMKLVPGNPNNDCFGVHDISGGRLDVLSKRDATLLRTVVLHRRPTYQNNFHDMNVMCILDEKFVVVASQSTKLDGQQVEVRALVADYTSSLVYRCVTSATNVARNDYRFRYKGIRIYDDYLVAICPQNDVAAIYWHLPRDFLESCKKHLRDGSVGTISECRVIEMDRRWQTCYSSTYVNEFGITLVIEYSKSLQTAIRTYLSPKYETCFKALTTAQRAKHEKEKEQAKSDHNNRKRRRPCSCSHNARCTYSARMVDQQTQRETVVKS